MPDDHRPTNASDYRRLVDNPDLIPGIYNYCDQWCERCELALRCATYVVDEEQGDDLETHDINNRKFWERMTEPLRVAMEMLYEHARELGIDLDAGDVAGEMARERRLDAEAGAHPCARSAMDYTRSAHAWMASAEKLFAEAGRDLALSAGVAGRDPADGAATLLDAAEVIQWYHSQIYVKLVRALGSRTRDAEEGTHEDYPRDHDGSAKVALLAMDRSMAAWGILLGAFPEQEKDIIEMLASLQGLRRMVEHEFPGARAFVRPGFDEV